MSNVQVRRAMPNDAEAISKLNAAVQDAHAASWPTVFKPASSAWFSPEHVRGLSAEPDVYLWLAELDGQLAGFAYAQVLRRPESGLHRAAVRLHLHGLGVARERRRRGCGRALMQTLLEAARELGITTLTLDVWSFNTEAKAFYEAAGFTVYNEAMRLDLSAAE